MRTALARALISSARPVATFSLRDFCGTHDPQYAFVTDRSRWIHVMTARQSGKTWGDDGILLDNALTAPRSTNLFLGLKGTGVRTSNWFPIWKPLCAKAGVPDEWHNETEMRTTFPNGARVMFAGTDDLSNVKKYLGNRLDHSVVILDEVQDNSDAVIRYLLKTLLPPMLTPTSRVILSGVLPDVPAGLFYELAATRPLADDPSLQRSKGWSHHEWGRAANVHTPEAMQQLADYMREHGLTIDDPQIQRDWYIRRVWNLDATAYKYSLERNGYTAVSPEWVADIEGKAFTKGRVMAAVPHEGITEFTVGIDPGGGDRTSVVGWGWGHHTTEVQHLFEWVTERDTSTSLSDIAEVCGLFEEHYPGASYVWDPGSGKMELDTFGQDYGIALIRAATKTDLPGQVRRNNDLLTKGWAKVMIGSKLEEDYQKARWDKDARAGGTWRWASSWHPDPSEAARYGLQGYYAAYTPPETPDPHRDLRERVQARFSEERPMWDKTGVGAGDASSGDPWDE